jgi:hypothetical protein
MAESILVMEGHILDSLLLPKVLDIIVAGGAEYEILEITIGRTRHDASHAKLKVSTPDAGALRAIVAMAKEHGAREAI